MRLSCLLVSGLLAWTTNVSAAERSLTLRTRLNHQPSCSTGSVSAGTSLGSLQADLAELQSWAGEESARIGTLLAGVDPKFAGVRRFGEILSARPTCRSRVASITDSSAVYWRARLEMVPDNPSVLLAKLLLLARCGEIDRAVRLLEIIQLLPVTESPETSTWPVLVEKLTAYKHTRDALVQTGVAAFDAGDSATAASYYDRVLHADSSSAWAWHERFFAMGTTVDKRVHDDYRRHVYGADPLYPLGRDATTGLQAFQMWRRMEIRSLFSDTSRWQADFLTYATIALDVGAYGFGAELFWTTFLVGANETRSESIDGFLYCLHRLGVDGIAANFTGDNEQRIKRVERACSGRLHASVMYRAMEVKE
jgi:hypothetical protein